MNVLKRGTQYVTVTANKLCFKDLMLFTCPMSLDKYLRTWGNEIHKMVYPYTLFKTVEELRTCVKFPPIEDFLADKAINRDTYESCKQMFENRMTLPDGHADKWYNFEDYLKFYNLSDVGPTSQALMNQFDIFHQEFGLSPLQCTGLPQFARKVMYKMYAKDSPAVFSFSPDSVATKVFRQQTIGGLVMVYKRHVTLDPSESAPSAAKANKNGKKFIDVIKFVDSIEPMENVIL